MNERKQSSRMLHRATAFSLAVARCWQPRFLGLVLLASPCGAQTVPAAHAGGSGISLLPVKPRIAAKATIRANHTFFRKELYHDTKGDYHDSTRHGA